MRGGGVGGVIPCEISSVFLREDQQRVPDVVSPPHTLSASAVMTMLAMANPEFSLLIRPHSALVRQTLVLAPLRRGGE